MGNYVSDRVGNSVSVTPLQVGNSVSADTNSGQALVHNLTMAGYLLSQVAENSAKRSSAACSVAVSLCASVGHFGAQKQECRV